MKPSLVKESTPASSPPKYRNHGLERIIADNKDSSELDLQSKNLTDQDMEIVAYYALCNNQTLHDFGLGTNRIGENEAKYLAEALRDNMTLNNLDFVNNQIGGRGAQYLFEALQQNRTIKRIDLQGNQIGADGTQLMCNALRNNTTLTWLSLHENQIGEQGTQYLAYALRDNASRPLFSLLHLDPYRKKNQAKFQEYSYKQFVTLNEYWKWLRNDFIPNLRAQGWYNGQYPQ
ncbi:unnamed protein product [Rotaria sp. Silwood1]|nr:unnamed protein product [Rotaria sp. Silwood1]